jgi:hypothetical protein
MAIIITDIGKQKALEYIVGKDSTTESLVLKLYSNNYTPAIGDSANSYIEVSGGLYSSISLTPATWAISSGIATYPQQSWFFTGSVGTVYGYYLVNSTSNQVIFAERFPNAPYTISNSGDIIRVTLSITLN